MEDTSCPWCLQEGAPLDGEFGKRTTYRGNTKRYIRWSVELSLHALQYLAERYRKPTHVLSFKAFVNTAYCLFSCLLNKVTTYSVLSGNLLHSYVAGEFPISALRVIQLYLAGKKKKLQHCMQPHISLFNAPASCKALICTDDPHGQAKAAGAPKT